MENAPVSSSSVALGLESKYGKSVWGNGWLSLMLVPLESPFFSDLLTSRLQHQTPHQASARLTLHWEHSP